ncbi:hypothetical protein [Phycicoccus sp. DTK01]|uniref:hypothetical protein n=1 Tax=Phycicoccus sp. DTK01 TaxID=2785745 RepID=UPI001A8D29F7|nr:hypothetical protein [Phycicoccus sp. DTK01]GIL33985.1 hypothetical protein PDTK01_00620 [Phycicoccus sp. DTK01]
MIESTPDYTNVVNSEWRARMDWDRLSDSQRAAIAEWGLDMFGLAAPVVEDIDEVKYAGRLVLLEDGSRWEVESHDADVSESWSYLTKVAVIDGVMYNLSDAEQVEVTEDE